MRRIFAAGLAASLLAGCATDRSVQIGWYRFDRDGFDVVSQLLKEGTYPFKSSDYTAFARKYDLNQDRTISLAEARKGAEHWYRSIGEGAALK